MIFFRMATSICNLNRQETCLADPAPRSQVALSKKDRPIDFMVSETAHTCKGGIMRSRVKQHLKANASSGDALGETG